MKYSILLCICALAFRIVYCDLIYAANSLQNPYLRPYAFRYSYTPSFVVPNTYPEYIIKHHHPDHHGTDNDWKPPQTVQLTDTSLSNKPENDVNKSPIIEIQPSVMNLYPDVSTLSDQIKYISTPLTYTIPTPLSWPTAAQFHQQDSIGQYYYGYANPISSKQEIKTIDGITRGAYSYIDANGKLQNVEYVSDDINGFRVAATNLPKSPIPIDIPDSPDIIKAKQEHFQAQKYAIERLNAANSLDSHSNINDNIKPLDTENNNE